MKKTLLLFLLIAIVSLVFYNKSWSSDMNINKEEKLKALDKMSVADRESLLAAIDKEWQTTKEILIVNLSSEQEQTRFIAAYLLGLYRYSQAANSLAKLITMESEGNAEEQREARWERFPAVEALIRIGKPSVLAMLRNLESSDDEKVRELSARVIYYVEGPALARIVVTNAMTKQNDLTKKVNLESSLRYFER